MRVLFMMFLVLSMQNCRAQQSDFFDVTKAECGLFDSVNKGYKIVLKDNPLKCSYDPNIFTLYSRQDVFQMISELLSLKGNVKKCVLPVTGYNPLKSQVYLENNKEYTIQLEALFIINQIYLKKPFVFSSHPVIYNTKTKQYLTGKEPEMNRVYELYESWFEKVNEIGLEKARIESLLPLEESIYRWY